MSTSSDANDRARSDQRHGHTPAEWITLLISSALILAVVAAVGYFTIARGNLPPTFRVEPQTAETRVVEGQYYLPVTVTNTGDKPAQEVRVRVDVQSDSATETSVFTLDLLAPGAHEEGVVVFSHDPTAGDVRAVVESFL